jgi:small subunit ribosomal protein S8
MIKTRVAEILRDEGFIRAFKVVEETGKRLLRIYLKYDDENQGVINGVHRMSRPGLRHYVGYRDLRKFKNGFGMSVLTTSRGLMTDTQAREQKVGGELIFSIW